MEHMEDNNLFNNKEPVKPGFLNGRSTVFQLVTVLNKWTKLLMKGIINCVYFNFKRAFDMAPNQDCILLSIINLNKISVKLKWKSTT